MNKDQHFIKHSLYTEDPVERFAFDHLKKMNTETARCQIVKIQAKWFPLHAVSDAWVHGGSSRQHQPLSTTREATLSSMSVHVIQLNIGYLRNALKEAYYLCEGMTMS